jgi:hypothetical protein
MDFGARIDELIGDGSGEFSNFHPFSVVQSTGGLAKGFHHQNWVSLPHMLHLMRSRCIPGDGDGAAAPLGQMPVKCLA